MPPRRLDESENPSGEGSPEHVPDELMGFGEEDEDASVVALRTDSYEESNVEMDPRRRMPSAMGAAPEVSPGAWRERAFTPRGTMPRHQVVAGLERAVQSLELQRLPVPVMREDLLGQWLPFLRQVVEQFGGDGIDAHLTKILRPPGRPGKDKFVVELSAAMKKIQLASSPATLLAEVRKVLKLVENAFTGAPRKVSLKLLESELEGRVDTNTVLTILFSTPEGLKGRLEKVEASANSLREMLRTMPGHSPDGMMSNYTRLKVERRVIEAELASRR